MEFDGFVIGGLIAALFAVIVRVETIQTRKAEEKFFKKLEKIELKAPH